MEMEAEATFITKENGVIAGITLSEMIFNQVDSSLQVSFASYIVFPEIIPPCNFGSPLDHV